MDQEIVTQMKSVKRSLARLAVLMDPQNDAEWGAFDRIVAAHKQMRGIDFSTLGQLELPLSEPETECPMCKGRCTIPDGTGEPAQCPQCKGIGKVKSKTLQSVLPVEPVVNQETDKAFAALESANPEAWRTGHLCATCVNACPDPNSRPEHVDNIEGKITTCVGYVMKHDSEPPPRRRGRPSKASQKEESEAVLNQKE